MRLPMFKIIFILFKYKNNRVSFQTENVLNSIKPKWSYDINYKRIQMTDFLNVLSPRVLVMVSPTVKSSLQSEERRRKSCFYLLPTG